VWFVAPDMVDQLWVSAEVKLISPTVLPATAEDACVCGFWLGLVKK